MGEGRVEHAPRARGRAAAAAPSLDELHRLAAARPELAWRAGSDLAGARNAHATNTRSMLADALLSHANFLEGDVRLGARGEPVMQHDPHDQVDLSLDQWLDVAAHSGRGVKVDVKDRAALATSVEAVRSAGIPDHRVLFNVEAWPAGDLLALRAAFPDATINVTPTSDRDLTATDLVRLQLAARIIGGPVMFPIRHDLLDANVVRALRPFGRIAAWNTPGLTNPGPRTEATLRRLGVDGMVDLREPTGFQHATAAAATGAAAVLGWGPVLRAVEAAGLL